MFYWITPQYSTSRVKNAGKRIRKGTFTAEDIEVVENFRASHAYILNTFQSNLRNRSRLKKHTVAQRLKRRHTIFDKLLREPNMQLSTMHDIAGCRVIFKNQQELYAFRDSIHKSRFKHKLLSDKDKYDYIKNPKETGYRGIHDVYEYCVSSKGGTKWNGLRIEIQYRTIYQHAWATAVEVADFITINRIKFDEADTDSKEFFKITSEIIARAYEGQTSCLSTLSNADLIAQFNTIEKKTNLLRNLRNLQKSKSNKSFKTNTLLIFYNEEDLTQERLDIETYESINQALKRYDYLEKELENKADIVLVRAENEASVKDAFRNYFSDAIDFVRYIEKGKERLLKS